MRFVGVAPALVALAALVAGCPDSELVPWEGGVWRPPVDASPADGGRRDGGRPDGAAVDGGVADAARRDAGRADAAPGDARPADAQPAEAGATDARPADADLADARPLDARPADAAPPDAGAELPPCPTFQPAQVTGELATMEVIEASGIAESWRTPGVFWTHNDSGDPARVFAFSAAGRHFATFELDGERPYDWEDLAVGPGPEPGRSYVYLGDVGDNLMVRANLRVRRFPEPEIPLAEPPPSVRVADSEAFTLVYPDGPHNAETLMVDPRSGDVYVVVKSNDGRSPVYRAAAPLRPGEVHPLERVADLTFGAGHLPGHPLTTGGSMARAGDALLIRTYASAFLWRRLPGQTVAGALASPPCPVPLGREVQGEAIGFAADGSGYFTISEGARPPIQFFRRQ